MVKLIKGQKIQSLLGKSNLNLSCPIIIDYKIDFIIGLVLEMPKFESLRPVGVMARTLGLSVRDTGSNQIVAIFHNSCA